MAFRHTAATGAAAGPRAAVRRRADDDLRRAGPAGRGRPLGGAWPAPVVLSLQRTAGNRAVAAVAGTGALGKKLGNEEELRKQGGQEPGGPAAAVEVVPRRGHGGPPPYGSEALCKAWFLFASSGAAASIGLGPGDYGLTYPENVTVRFTAKKDTATNTWHPNVWTITGNYSQQVRLLPGQTEITGPLGNTDVANYASQARALKHLGNTADPWYKKEAVRRHENVHASRFKPALNDSNAAISAAVEAVTVPHVPGMTSSTAKAQLSASAGLAAALTGAQATWLANILTRVAGDHAPGGPTDSAEKWVTEPARWAICGYRAIRGWPATPDC